MNPKTHQDLDPKLKEAYDRVMGGNFTPPPSPAAAPNPIPKTETAPFPPAANPQPTTPLTNPVPVVAGMPPLNVMSPTTSPSAGQELPSAKKKLKASPIIFLIAGLAFFAIYAVVWGKIFKLF